MKQKKIDWNKLWENLPTTREQKDGFHILGYTRAECEIEKLMYVVLKLIDRLNEILK